jgi:hypothetical protein
MRPDPSVMAAMNEVNAAQRMRVANLEKAEADKVLLVKLAEADAEAKHLSGLGTARMRQVRASHLGGGAHGPLLVDAHAATCRPLPLPPSTSLRY